LTLQEGRDFNYEAFEKETLERLMQGAPLTGDDGILTPSIKRCLEASMKGALDAHVSVDQGPNRRNGKKGKTVKTSLGNVQVNTPRDRQSSFDPQILRKRQTVLNEEIDNKILSPVSPIK